MNLEKDDGKIRWYKEKELRIKLKNLGTESEVWVTLNGYNICLKLMMFDFVERIKDDLMPDISIKRVLHKQRVFMIDSDHALELANHILEFVNEWNIKISANTVSNSDIIPDELWYE